MPPPPIAKVYTKPPRHFILHTGPGRTVTFRGGEGIVYNEHDMPVVLQREDMIVVPDERYVDWLPKWLESCGERTPPRADLQLPDGFEIKRSDEHWVLHRPESSAEPDRDEHGNIVDAGSAREETLDVAANKVSRKKSKVVDDPQPSWDPPVDADSTRTSD